MNDYVIPRLYHYLVLIAGVWLILGSGPTPEEESNLTDVTLKKPNVSSIGVINDTGVTTCYSEEESCHYVSHDSKHGIDAYDNYPGGPAAAKAAKEYDSISPGCVSDSATNLIWEVKSSSGIRGKANAYIWDEQDMDAYVAANMDSIKADCLSSGIECGSTTEYIQYLNAIQHCGKSNWRLPTTHELTSLKSLQSTVNDIDSAFFPDTDGTYHYWTSEIAVAAQGGNGPDIYTVSFGGGVINTNSASLLTTHNLFGKVHIRAVANEKDIDTPIGLGSFPRATGAPDCRQPHLEHTTRLCFDRTKGEILDFDTGRVWKRCAIGTIWRNGICEGLPSLLTYGDADALIAESNTAREDEHNDWKIPNIFELMSIAWFDSEGSAINPTLFPSASNAGVSDGIWSSTPFAGDRSQNFYLRIQQGIVYSAEKEISPQMLALTARGDGLVFSPLPENDGGWRPTYGSEYHVTGITVDNHTPFDYFGDYVLDESCALDLNYGATNDDRGEAVYAVAPGIIVDFDKDFGYILIKHMTPIRLESGKRLREWYTGYMHLEIDAVLLGKLEEVRDTGNTEGGGLPSIDRDATRYLGTVSNNTPLDDHLDPKDQMPSHLHFGLYKPTAIANSLESLNIFESFDSRDWGKFLQTPINISAGEDSPNSCAGASHWDGI
ncbi:MAG: hypothetical protein OI74_04485 [Gammaproteobacteria bacterium (ex Lamellibrachia satsuma)]|nr:MAG: DUF1566 domain-containing protein [Gammaproteobacteria bacterium (ex Lamellibrachia satsuma)]RRS34363.1 MAG: hypothetical protein NV67_13885 [Gammaproteobacteria bacterium (ex Lamellibrachia satsuma)]RRS34763.1 MAG: hypothetical protein OI74_04485 [Gammaproteobacteria bacterium (ex Lamellibrachia satsuma)]